MEIYQIVLIVLGVLALLTVGWVLLYNRLQRLRIKVAEGGAGIDVALEMRFDLLSEQIETVKKYLAHEHQLFTDVTALRTGADLEEKLLLQREGLSQEALRTIDARISQQAQRMEQIRRQLDRSALTRSDRAGRQEAQAKQREAGRQTLSQTAAQLDRSINQKMSALAGAHHDLANVEAGFDALAEQYPVLSSWVTMERFQRSITDAEEHLQAARRLYNANVSRYNQTVKSIPWSIVAALCHMEQVAFYEIEAQKRSFSVNFDGGSPTYEP